jgi:hypothetical protein
MNSDKNYSFIPWEVLYGDIELPLNFNEYIERKKKAYIDGDLDFSMDCGFVRFETSMIYSGTIVFRSNQGILLLSKGK